MTVVEKFANTLSPDVRSNTRKIEDEFREFCKTTKGKENRFVSIRYKMSIYKVPCLLTLMLIKYFI